MSSFETEIPPELAIDESDLTLEETVGSGITADVYRGALDFHQGEYGGQRKVVAIKQLRDMPSSMAQSQAVAFARELKILSQVRHQNLVQLFGVSYTRNQELRIVTEFCDGGCCFELLHNAEDVEISCKQQIAMCHDVAKAMNYLHSFEPMIIHRDLKSLNLLLDQQVTGPEDDVLVKVSDFGGSKLKGQEGWGKMTAQAGTKHWMAPEMWQGTTYDEKVDVFSYAMVIFEIVCREVPFEEEEPNNVGQYTLQGIRPDMNAVPPHNPKLLTELMQACWQQDPSMRPGFTDITLATQKLYDASHR
eukprot:TRINITY_DN65724_c0_g1_i1.p1 TRINITY_DN65724_c0_g1~~TRINITY_DN65724_c0_g1_i1.p1  ORF type:complete len:304 (-),score=48.44 TRINITY_DN65724_c0_g1_i1:330-1241(-)